MKKQKSKRSGKFFVYIVECSDGTYYTGYTLCLKRRMELHNKGKGAKYTRNRRPVSLVWSKVCKNKTLAMRTENIIKKLKREDKKRIVQGERLDNVLRSYKQIGRQVFTAG